MTFRLEILNPLDIADWDEKVMLFKDYSFFHSQSWARVLAGAYNYKPYYFTLWEKDHLRAVIPMFEVSGTIFPKKGVSLPFTDHCAPLVSQPKDFNFLFQAIIKEGRSRQWKRIELRCAHQLNSNTICVPSYNLHRLDLTRNEAALLKKFRSSTRRNITRARQNQVTVTTSTDLSALEEFFRLNCITRRHHGVPPQPFHFFKCIHEHLLKKRQGIIVLARHGRHPVAAAIFFHLGRKAMYKYGASSRERLEMRPNNLVMWEAIKWYALNEYVDFDMGRSEPDNIGLNQFKNGWGTTIEKIFYSTFDIPQMKFCRIARRSTAGIGRIFQKMPVPVLKMVGELAYRHMG